MLPDSIPAVDLGAGRATVALSLGYWHSCALLADGTAKCWGFNDRGQLGVGDVRTRGNVGGQMGDNLPVVIVGCRIGWRLIDTAIQADRDKACRDIDECALQQDDCTVRAQFHPPHLCFPFPHALVVLDQPVMRCENRICIGSLLTSLNVGHRLKACVQTPQAASSVCATPATPRLPSPSAFALAVFRSQKSALRARHSSTNLSSESATALHARHPRSRTALPARRVHALQGSSTTQRRRDAWCA